MVVALALPRIRGSDHGPLGNAARLGALGATASLLQQSLFHDVLYDGEPAMTLFFMAGLAVACLRPAPEPAAAGAPTL